MGSLLAELLAKDKGKQPKPDPKAEDKESSK